jgi:hypothetical protein
MKTRHAISGLTCVLFSSLLVPAPGCSKKDKEAETAVPAKQPLASASAPADCERCEAAGDCAIFSNNCESPLLSADDRKLCKDITTCVKSSHCFEGSSATLGSCYCGKLDTKACLAAPMSGPGAPDGACHDLILRGMPNAKTQSNVLGNLTTRTQAAGLALSRLNCQKIGYKQACARVCGWLE